MGEFLFVIALIITAYSYLDRMAYDQKQTNDSKKAAERDNAYTFSKYKGKGHIHHMRDTNKKVYEINGLVKEMYTGKIILDIYEENRKRMQQYVIDRCKQKGYNFYPLVHKVGEKRFIAPTGGCPILVDMETGYKFYFIKPGYKETHWGKFYCMINGETPKPYEKVKFDFDIGLEMLRLVDESFDACYRRF